MEMFIDKNGGFREFSERKIYRFGISLLKVLFARNVLCYYQNLEDR